MPIRITGMNSGLDTDTIIKDLVKVKQTKVDDLKRAQSKLGWKQEAWKGLNDKIKKLHTGTLGDLRYQYSFSKKTTGVSNSNAVSITTASDAMDCVQQLQISKLAKAGYLTGGKISDTAGNKVTSGSKLVDKLGIQAGSKMEVTVDGKTTEITVDENTTIDSFVSQLKSAGVSANFDAGNQRLYIGTTGGTGADKDFALTASNPDGTDALKKLGVLVYDDKAKEIYEKYAGMATDADAKQKAVDAYKAGLLSKYTNKANGYKAANEKLEKSQTDLVASYKTGYGDAVDLTDNTARAARKTDVNDRISALGEIAEPTEAEKAELDKLKGELSHINGYEANKTEISTNQAQLDLLYLPHADGEVYLNADGTAGNKITQEAEAYVQGKIDEAAGILADYANNAGSTDAVRILGQDAVIELNGVTYTSGTNTFAVNGLTITCKAETGSEPITLTTESDNSGTYDMVKSFIKEYSELVNEMDKLYNADSSKGYEPMTDEEKAEVSDKEAEKWDQKIKDSLLRRDSTLNSVSGAMKEIMSSGYSVNGKTMYLSDFGIETLGYFNAADNEKNAYYINGDKDFDAVKGKDNDLMAMIEADPKAVSEFFSSLSKSLYSKVTELTSTNAFRTKDNVYDDKKMKEDYVSYTAKIKAEEKKLAAYEEKWYSKFTAMETALAKMQSNSSAVTSLLGG